MDAIDRQIIAILRENCRVSNSQIAEEVHLSIPAVGERIRKLKDNGYINKFTIRLNREKTGQTLQAFIFVTLNSPGFIEPFLRKVREEVAVLACHHLAGEYDYLLKVAVAGTTDLENLISDVIKKIKGVVRTNTMIVLSTVKEEL